MASGFSLVQADNRTSCWPLMSRKNFFVFYARFVPLISVHLRLSVFILFFKQ